jgi:protein-tyrosine phosphatase
MVDIHSHVVWGLDDGAIDIEQSLAILRDAAETGTTDIVATPHSNSQFRYRPDLLKERIAELNAALGGKPRIHSGCDFHLSFDNMEELFGNPRKYSINGTQYLLVECPDFSVGGHTERLLQQMVDIGLVPVITHPERNPVLQRNTGRIKEWVDLGCLVQLTARSICGGFGKTAASVSIQLLKRGIVHAVASDAHDPEHRHARLDEAYGMIKSRFGKDDANLLFTQNPQAIIEGRPLSGANQGEGPSVARPWWQFWHPAC